MNIREKILNHWFKREKLTTDGIIELHNIIIEESGRPNDCFGVLNRSELEFVVDQINYESKDIYWKAALILRNITGSHPFLEGNKRTAYEVADTYLRMHGYKISASNRIKKDFMLHLASHQVELDEVIDWLKQYVVKT